MTCYYVPQVVAFGDELPQWWIATERNGCYLPNSVSRLFCHFIMLPYWRWYDAPWWWDIRQWFYLLHSYDAHVHSHFECVMLLLTLLMCRHERQRNPILLFFFESFSLPFPKPRYSKRAQIKWRLALLLLKNPSLRKYRRTHLKADVAHKKSIVEVETQNNLLSDSIQDSVDAKGGNLHITVGKTDQGALVVWPDPHVYHM